jgi:hypothetical protein
MAMRAGKRTYHLGGIFLIVFIVAVGLVHTLGKLISGGAPMEKKVMAALKTNIFLVRAFNGPITKIRQSNGP